MTRLFSYSNKLFMCCVIWLLSTVQNITATCIVSVSRRGTKGQKQCLSIIHKDDKVFKWKCTPEKRTVRHLKHLQYYTHLNHCHAAMHVMMNELFSTAGMSECLDWFSPRCSLSSRRSAHTVPLLQDSPSADISLVTFAKLVRITVC